MDIISESAPSLSELIKEKELYEARNTEELINTVDITEDIMSSSLVEERELYIAQANLALTPALSPSLTPGFIAHPFMITDTSSLFENFIVGYESEKTETKDEENNGRKYTEKERKVAGTKGTITAKIPEGTIIRTAEGETISESMLDILSLETEKKTKAQKKYEKTMKNRGNKKK